MGTTGVAKLYSINGELIEEWSGTITNIVNYSTGITTFLHNGNRVTIRNGIISIVESHRCNFDNESNLDYPP